MEEIIVKVKSSKDAEHLKAVLRKMNGVQINSVHNGSKSKQPELPIEPASKEELLKRIQIARKQGKSGQGISLNELKQRQLKWLKRKS